MNLIKRKSNLKRRTCLIGKVAKRKNMNYLKAKELLDSLQIINSKTLKTNKKILKCFLEYNFKDKEANHLPIYSVNSLLLETVLPQIDCSLRTSNKNNKICCRLKS